MQTTRVSRLRKQIGMVTLSIWLLTFDACTKEKSRQSDSAGTQGPPTCRTLYDLMKHDGEVVTIFCRNAIHAEQHPMGLHDTITDSGEHLRKIHTYVELIEQDNSPQVVLTSNQLIECPGVICVIGEVDVVDLGGPKGTKLSYGRPWIKVHSFSCKTE